MCGVIKYVVVVRQVLTGFRIRVRLKEVEDQVGEHLVRDRFGRRERCGDSTRSPMY